MHAVRNLLVVISLVCLTSTLAFATPINGTFSFGGATVRVGLTQMDYGPPLPSFLTLPGLVTVGITTGDAIGIIPVGPGGEILDLDQTVYPAGVPIPTYANFITFTGAPLVHLDLTFIYPGVNPLSPIATPLCTGPGNLCTPNLGPGVYSPFNLQNLAPTWVHSFIRGFWFSV